MSLRKIAISGIKWTLLQQLSTKSIAFIVSIILARLLLPSEFGLLGMIAIFIAIGNTLIDSGLTQSLIRSSDLDQDDYSTVFFFNLAASAVIYLVLYFGAPLIADFFNQPILISLVRVYCLSFIISAFSAIQQTRLTKAMEFKIQMTIAIPSLIGGSIVGVFLAFKGYGVWSLVWMHLFQSVFSGLQLWFLSGWAPSLVFSKEKFKRHFLFGFKLTLSGLLNTLFNNLYQIVIGRYFSAAHLGFYSRSESLKQLPVDSISRALNKVTYPMFASIQNDNERLKRAYKQIMQMVLFLIAPILIFLGVLAEPIFRFLFTDKWLPAVPYFHILCVTGILYPLHAYNLNILIVKGQTGLFLKLEVIKKIATIAGIIISLPFGIFALLWSSVCLSVFSFFVNTYYSGKILNYPAFEQVKDIAPILFGAFLSGTIVFATDYLLGRAHQIDFVRIAIGSLIGGSFYLGCASLFKFEALNQVLTLLRKK